MPVVGVALAWSTLHLPASDVITELTSPGHSATSTSAQDGALAQQPDATVLPRVESPSSSTASSKATGKGSTGAVRSTTATAPATATKKATPHGVTAAAQDLTDIAYATGSDAQKLDLYLPRRTGTAIPLVVAIHGGAWIEGDKGSDKMVSQAELLTAKGYAVASVNYRLSGEATFPAGAQDVKAAVRWLRAHSATYGIDPGRFGAWGESAGGYLALLLGTTGDQKTIFDNASLGNASTSSAVQVVVDLFGPANILQMDQDNEQYGGCPGAESHDSADSADSQWMGAPLQTIAATVRTADPALYLAKARTLPKFVIAHGRADCTVSYGQSVEFAAAARKAGASVSLELKDGIGHNDPSLSNDYAPGLAALAATFGR